MTLFGKPTGIEKNTHIWSAHSQRTRNKMRIYQRRAHFQKFRPDQGMCVFERETIRLGGLDHLKVSQAIADPIGHPNRSSVPRSVPEQSLIPDILKCLPLVQLGSRRHRFSVWREALGRGNDLEVRNRFPKVYGIVAHHQTQVYTHEATIIRLPMPGLIDSQKNIASVPKGRPLVDLLAGVRSWGLSIWAHVSS